MSLEYGFPRHGNPRSVFAIPRQGQSCDTGPNIQGGGGASAPAVSVAGRCGRKLTPPALRRRDTIPREDLVQLLEEFGIDPSVGFVAREIEQHTRPEDGLFVLPNSRSHLLNRVTEGKVAVPAWPSFTSTVGGIASKVQDTVKGGHNADYIQVLRDADPTKFAVSIVTVDGQRFNYGDIDYTFSMQSCSKPLSYAIAVDEAGGAAGLSFVHSHVGSEASGLAFNSISVNEDGVAHNPMVNAGAISVCSLVGRHCPDLSSRFAYLMSRYRELAGVNEVGFSQATYLCEFETAYRNNAILYTLSEAGVFKGDSRPDDALDLYIQACSMEISTETAAMMAATLANGGVQPVTGKRVLSPTAVKAALTLCFSCGLYDGSGTWASTVGLPAKSGVAGLIYTVIPGVAGVAVFSPPLNSQGNSVRGVAFCQELVRQFPFGMFDKAVSDVLKKMSPPVRSSLLYLPPHLRRALVSSPHRKSAARKDRAVASLSTSSARLAEIQEYDSDDDSTLAELMLAHAEEMGIDVRRGIDFSAAFRQETLFASADGEKPLEDVLDDVGSVGGETNRAFVSQCVRRLHSKMVCRRILGKLGELFRAFRSLQSMPLAMQAPKASLRQLPGSPRLDSSTASIASPAPPPPPGCAVPLATLVAFLESKGIRAREGGTPRVETVLNRLSKGTGYVTFQDLILSEYVAADSLLWRTMLGELVVADFGQLQAHTEAMVSSVKCSIPPIPARRDGSVDVTEGDEIDRKETDSKEADSGRKDGGGTASFRGKATPPPKSSKASMDSHRDKLDAGLKAAAGLSPGMLGAALCTCDGQIVMVGDAAKKVILMETVFPLLYAIALEDSGVETVNSWTGTEPSSHPSDSFDLLNPGGSHGSADAEEDHASVDLRPLGSIKTHPSDGVLMLDGVPELSLSNLDEAVPKGQSTGAEALQDVEALGGVPPSLDRHALPPAGALKPYNCCTLSGALAATACIGRGQLRKRERMFKDPGGRFTHILERVQEWAGGARVGFNNEACLLLKQQFLRCKAMAHYLKGMSALPARADPADTADALMQCMSIEASAAQLAVIAATFARAGACPTTDKRCMRPSTVRSALSTLYTCGTGSLSGAWQFNVGLPATFGSTGVTFVVIPGLGGLALVDGIRDRLTYSQPIPARSLKFCEMLVKRFRVNMFETSASSSDSGQGQITAQAKATAVARPKDVAVTLLSFELTTAAGEGDLSKVNELLGMGADARAADYDARSPLHIACCEGHLGVVQILLKHGADPMSLDRWKQTPFAEAVRCGHGAIVRVLEAHLVSKGLEPPSNS
jgi:glutaminase